MKRRSAQQITAYLISYRHVCHGITVGLSADVSAASATLPALPVSIVYHIYLQECERIGNPLEINYFFTFYLSYVAHYELRTKNPAAKAAGFLIETFRRYPAPS